MSRVSRTDYSGDRIAKLEKQIESLYTINIKSRDRIAKLEKQMKGIQVDQDDEDAQWKWIKKSRALLSGMDYKFMIIEERVEALEERG